jgi:hypothetical protein
MPAEQQPSLAERLAAMRERVETLVQRIDVRAIVASHPWEVVGAAALLGAWVGFDKPRGDRSKVGRIFVSAAGALAIRLAREAAFRQLGEIAMRWWEETGSKVGADREPEARRDNGRSDRPHA